MINSDNGVNSICLDFIKELGLYTQDTDIETKKIDGSRLEIFGMIIISLLIKIKIEIFRFLEKTFILINIGMSVALRMPLFTLSNEKVNFVKWELY